MMFTPSYYVTKYLVQRDWTLFSESLPDCLASRADGSRVGIPVEFSENRFTKTIVQFLLSLGNVRESRPSLPNLAMRVTALETETTLVLFVPPSLLFCVLLPSPCLKYE